MDDSKHLQTTNSVGMVGAILFLIYNILKAIDPPIFSTVSGSIIKTIVGMMSLLIVVGFLGIVLAIEKWRQPLVLLLSLQIIYYVIFIINPFPLELTVNRIRLLIFAIPVILIYYTFWEIDHLSKLLLLVKSVRTIIRVLSLSALTLSIINLVLLVFWFSRVKNVLVLVHSHELDDKKPAAAPRKGKVVISEAIPPSVGKFIPNLLFWCENCNHQVTGIKLQSYKDEDVARERNCPSCNAIVLSFWANVSTDQYNKMTIFASLFLGGIITTAFTSLGSYGVVPIVIMSTLAIISILVGVVGGFSNQKKIRTVNAPPPGASNIAPLGPNRDASKNMINYGVRITIGGFLVYGFIMIVTGILN